jgi:hypothetical protein
LFRIGGASRCTPTQHGGRRESSAIASNKKTRLRAFPLPQSDPRWNEIGGRLEESHLAKIVERHVSQLDTSPLELAYRGSGSAAFDPVCLLRMVLYQ